MYFLLLFYIMNFKRNSKININERNSLFENMLGKVYNKPINLYGDLPEKLKTKCFWENENEPSIWVSLLIPSYNTNKEYLIACINSIKEQIGTFGLEVVWINDSSNDLNTNILVNLLDTMIRPLKNCKLVYERLEKNSGISFSLNYGVKLCSNEIIFRLDSDDIMKYDRIIKQLKFILSTPSCVMCGTNVTSFEYVNGIFSSIGNSKHKNILTWNEYKNNPKSWILNHPSLCFKKSAILNVGNYREDFKYPFEDLELELRVLKTYGILYNLKESLVFYRIHTGQLSSKNSQHNEIAKKSLIQHMVSN